MNLFDSIFQIKPIQIQRKAINNPLTSIRESDLENDLDKKISKKILNIKYSLIEDNHYEFPFEHSVGYKSNK